MAQVKRFEDLEVWKLSRELNRKIIDLIQNKRFGRSYRFINQIEASSGSVMDNIAEGFERGTRAEFIQFLGYSKGSCGELRSQIYRAYDQKCIDLDEHEELLKMAGRISSMTSGLILYLQGTHMNGVRKKSS